MGILPMSLTGVPPVVAVAFVVLPMKKKKKQKKQQITGKMPVRLMGKMPMLRSFVCYWLLNVGPVQCGGTARIKHKEYTMKYWTSVLAIVILALGSWSCKKEETPSQYDANIDAPPTIAQVPADSGILKDQRKISAAANIEGISTTPTTPNKGPGTSTTKPVTPESAPSTPATGTGNKPSDKTIEEITEVIVKMNQAIMAKPTEVPAQYMTAECAAAMAPFVATSLKVGANIAKLKVLIKSKGIQVPPAVDATLKTPNLTDGLTNPDMTKTAWEETPEGVYVYPTGKGGKQPDLYVGTPNGWKYEMSKTLKSALPLLSDVVTAQDKFAAALTAGLTNGSITKANFEAKAAQFTKEILGPAATKMMQFMTQNAPKSGGGGN
jgi:hypothetical protein